MSPVQTRPSAVRALFSFPDPVNEVSARLVAGGVVLMAALTLAFGLRWGVYVLAYGFVARVLTGPTLSPLGQLATRVLTPALPFAPRPVAGPPKRFAQAMGAVFTVGAALATAFGVWWVSQVLLGLLIVAASLESFVGFCIGCKVFGVLIRLGVVPETVCERCANITYPSMELGAEPVAPLAR